jgi:holliday junction DNA helicase RuvA
MITRIGGKLISLDEFAAEIQPGGLGAEPGSVTLEVLVPAFLQASLGTKLGQRVELATLMYLESQNQGAAYVPRLIGFESAQQREFFELFTTVKGIGNRKALRAMAEPPSVIADAIVTRNARALTQLPEIGKRLAETVIAELSGKVEKYLLAMGTSASSGPARGASRGPTGVGEEAINALVGLGETRVEAERLVRAALEKIGPEGADVERVLAAVYASR